MRVLGVVAEYNPFHMGHARHLSEARALSGCDYAVVVMSGAFTQRGEPAIIDKWTRARMALLHGADLVIELPALYAVRPAEIFASAGVSLLARLGASCLSFGREARDENLLRRAAETLENEPPELSARVREALGRGETLARARGAALNTHLGADAAQLALPNNALAVEYLRANARLARPLEIFSVERAGNYHDADLDAGGYASAGAIRSAALSGRLNETLKHLPEPELFARAPRANPDALDNLLLYTLRGMTRAQIAALCDVGEGLEDRVARCAERATDRKSLLALLKCKRYTYARLSRVCAAALLALTRPLAEAHPTPPYARALGFRRDAAPLLRWIKREAETSLSADAALLKNDPVFQADMRASDLFGLCASDPALRAAKTDLTRPPVIL